MGLLDRFRTPPAVPAGPAADVGSDGIFAVPLTPAEAGRLVQALREHDRLTRLHRPDIGYGAGYSRSEAETISRTTGVAAALGHPVVPHLVQSVTMHDGLLIDLQRWTPGAALTRDLEQLLTKMQLLAGMARLRQWHVRYDPAAGGMRWTTVPTDIPGSPTDAGPRRESAVVASALPGRPTVGAPHLGAADVFAARMRDVHAAAGDNRLTAHALRELAAAATTLAGQLHADADRPGGAR
ncbi:hypothetical protein [Micromonospora sp. WMMD737]|uniref:hypothetical protein n=1 Tax=Micromonospora sp. WMMD737 TaxID=3404113 RepID=UPI003B967736